MRFVAAAIVLFAISPVLGQAPSAKNPVDPHRLLPADCVAYLSYDGYVPHRKAYDRTALATAMKEGLGEFLEHFLDQISLADGDGPAKDAKQKVAQRRVIDRFFQSISERGFALTLEVAPPPVLKFEEAFQLTVVFPRGAEGNNRQAFEDFFRMVSGGTAKPVDCFGRPGHAASLGEIQAAWWPEGKHYLFALGVRPVPKARQVIKGGRANVTAAAWHAELKAFDRFETDVRGRVDLRAVVEHLAMFGLDSPGMRNIKDHVSQRMLLRHLGCTGLVDLSFHLGFDGKYQRSSVRLGVVEPPERAGLLRLMSAPAGLKASGPAALEKLPPLPPDADYVSVRRFDWHELHTFLRASGGLLALSNLFSGQIGAPFPNMDHLIGGDFRKDFLDQLGDTLVTWGGHSEGPFFLGQGFAVNVKDTAKVSKGLRGMVGALAKLDDAFAAEKQVFRGRDVYVFSKLPVPVSFTLHDDWLVAGLFPQPVQGFLLRSGGKYRVWKAPPELAETLAKERKSPGRAPLLGVSVSDPRPAIEMGLAVLPVFVHGINHGLMRMGASDVDVKRIPNAQAINEWLFPNIAFVYDDGNALRWEHHYSINEPDDFLLLAASPLAPQAFGILRRMLPEPRVREPEIVPEELRPIEAPKKPAMYSAKAVEKDGMVWITVTRKELVPGTVTIWVSENIYKSMKGSDGVERKVKVQTMRPVVMTDFREVSRSSVFALDGKKIQLTRKDGSILAAKEVLRLLEKATQVLVAPHGEIDPAELRELGENTLILRVGESSPPEKRQ